MRAVGWIIGTLLALWLLGCAFMPNEAVPFDPPESYRAVWDSAQACTGVRKPFERLTFFVVPGADRFEAGADSAAGRTRGHRIVLAEVYADHPMVVKHEMIHALIGGGDHPARPFERPCHATWATYNGPEELPE